jgi:hypothetical protein
MLVVNREFSYGLYCPVIFEDGVTQIRIVNACHNFEAYIACERWVAGWMSGGLNPGKTENFSLHHRVQPGSGAHPAFYPMGIRGYFSGGKVAGA